MDTKSTLNNDTPHEDWEDIQTMFDTPTQSDTAPLRSLLENFQSDLQHHPYVAGGQRNQTLSAPQWLIWAKRLLAPATTLAVIVIALSILSRPTPTWGQVVAKFQDMTFFSASIYSKENGLSKPEHIELWMGQGGKVRVRIGQQLIYAEKGEVLAAFDLKSRTEVDPNYVGVNLINMLGASETFSMQSIFRSMNRGGDVDKTPVLNENAMISGDLAVFDLEIDGSTEWMRIWALKESGLPIRIRLWNPRNASSLEVLFDYSKSQSKRFFDPKAFARVISQKREDALNLAYLFLEDAGGKHYVPGIPNPSKLTRLVTTTIDGASFSLSDYVEDTVLLYFWDRHNYRPEWLKAMSKHYASTPNLKIVTVALEKSPDKVKKLITSKGIEFPVLQEPGKAYRNSLARTLGVKDSGEKWIVRKGQPFPLRYHDEGHKEILDLACKGLDYETDSWLSLFIKMFKTTKAEIQDLCGEPHETKEIDERVFYYYRFLDAEGLRKKEVIFRFDESGFLSGHSQHNHLIEPSSVSIRFSSEYWHSQVVPQLGRENMPDRNSEHQIEIALYQGNTCSMIGGGHPRQEIEPDIQYDRELAAGTYALAIQITHSKKYRRMAKLDLIDELTLGKNESLDIVFDQIGEPNIKRSTYKRSPQTETKEKPWSLEKKPDYKQMVKNANQRERTYDDPKYLPWKLHLKEIARVYKNRPLPVRVELIPKKTDESYPMIMFPKNLPGYEGYSATAWVGDLKERFLIQPLGVGITRWPEETPSITLNHDLVYRDDASMKEKYRFALQEVGYKIESVIEERTVFVAKYDGRDLPDPETVSAPGASGWGYVTARQLLESLTRVRNWDYTASGPLFIDETGLPFEPGEGQTYQDIAISMEYPNSELDLETLRPWYKDTFGITFTQEIRPMEILVIRKQE
ncbi:MAG: redoxin domain-containing protein [Phycisphaeraceae bacterium]|nr:redoxin domain-containing protein [Phycisphaeraceae bacterium]